MSSHPTSRRATEGEIRDRAREAVDRFLPPARWQLSVRPIRRFGTIDRLTWLLESLTDVSDVRIRRLDRGVAVFEIFYRGQFSMDALLTNALAPLGATVRLNGAGRADVNLDTGEPTTGDAYAFSR